MQQALLDTSQLAQNGLYTATGTINLIAVRGLTGSLDDRINDLWRVGQTVILNCYNESNVLQRHPVGALRIKSSEYNYESRSLTIQVCCLLTLMSFKQPTEPLEGEDPEEIESANNSRLHIVTQLLNKAGITSINCPIALPYPINYPIEPRGSYLETAGQILYSAGYVAWIDRYETCQIKPVSLTSPTSFNLTIGGDRGDEVYYRRLSNSEGPREIIKVSGFKRLAEIPKYPNTSKTEKYGTAKQVDSSLGNDRIVISRETLTEEYNDSTKVLTTTKTIEQPIGLVLPGENYASAGMKLQSIQSEVETTKKYYERDKKGKLLRIETQIQRVQGAVLAEYFKAKEEAEAQFVGKSNPITALSRETTYEYDSKERPIRITTIEHEPVGALLANTNYDWEQLATIPSGPTRSKESVESWKRRHGNEWEHKLEVYAPLSRIQPEAIKDEMLASDRTVLVIDNNSSFREISNAGQTVPPAVERYPEVATFQDKRVCGEARFSQYGGNPFRERERTYSIEYLGGGKVVEESSGGVRARALGNGYFTDCTDEQCKRIAEIEGALLYGRFKGQELQIGLKDELFGWEPLMRVNCQEPGGVIRAFALDDSHWYLGQEKALVNFGAIWVGDAVGAEVRLPYVVQRSLTARGVGGASVVALPYNPSSNIVISIVVRGIGRATVTSDLTSDLAWKTMTREQWQSITVEQWKNLV